MTATTAGLPAISAVMAAAGAAVLSATLITLLFPLLKRYALVRPNARSSHHTPTPQGGGIAVVGAMIAAIAMAYGLGWLGSAVPTPLAVVVVGAVVMACLGAIDDVRPLPVVPRFFLQLIVVGTVILALPEQSRIVPPLPWWLERSLLVLGGLWFVNLVNFMDGLDLMTVAEALPLTAALVVLGHNGALPAYATIVALALGGAVLGFAYFNRPVAKLFLGDVGSLPIGLVLGWLLLMLAAGGHLIAAIVMPLYYLADASLTLVRRLSRGERLWQAHRTHFYQLATDRGFTVTEVVALVFAANLGLCALAIMTVIAPNALTNIAALLGGAIVVAGLLFVFARGRQ